MYDYDIIIYIAIWEPGHGKDVVDEPHPIKNKDLSTLMATSKFPERMGCYNQISVHT